ncbi:DinB family protein [Nocardioides aequoreus]|uniref:DinB family protein n=1 Tax=Nocardioides aequoreus TaxID=397278 RepID=UPI0004C3469B|nr:DinB family protein [Nocardioides aequoreus]
MSSDDDTPLAPERADLLEAVAKHRALFLVTVRGLTDDQARARPTVSELCLGGLVRHLAHTEAQWVRFVEEGPAAPIDWEAVDWSDPPPEVVAQVQSFQMGEEQTLAGLVADYERAAEATDALVRTTDLDARQPLPEAPWFEPGASWSARRVVTHLVAEIAQHAGHADILRESIDGQKTMG